MLGLRVLGPLRLRAAGTDNDVELTVMLQRLLALLICRAGRPVRLDAIIEALWQDRPPRTARKTVQIYVHRLRRLLEDDQRVAYSDAGYALSLAPDEVDAQMFEALLEQAAAAGGRGELDQAGRLLDKALRMWHGPAYAGLADVPAIAAEAARLEERRLTAFEDHTEIGLELGRHAELSGQLAAAIAEHPYRERLRGQLMTALFRDGRQAEALETYRQTRQLLVAEVGVEPSAELQRLHQAILRGDPTPAQRQPVRKSTSPYRFLPHDVPEFVGREEDLAWLDQRLEGSSTLVITAIAGAAGIGKTALAVRWAHRNVDRFPDGQLYVNLRGYDAGPPLRPFDALVHLLRCLGVPHEQLPAEVDEAAARYRALLADRHMLVVLDNARTADQVRPLLPGQGASQVVITSRDRLSGLVAHDGARRLTLGLLPDEKGLALLRRLLGDARVDAEPRAAAEVVALCAGLPLALRIAAANLADRPGASIAAYARDLAHGNRLAELSVGGDEGRAVKAVLDYSYQALNPVARKHFRLLGLVPGPDFTVEAMAVLGAVERLDAASALDTLAAAHLIERHASGRYSFHDLVREYAGSLIEPGDTQALRLLLDYLRDTVVVANSFIIGGGPAPDGAHGLTNAAEAMAWLEAERANLTAAVAAAAAHDWPELAVELAGPMGQFFHFATYTSDWVRTFEIAFNAIEHLGETRAKYFVLNSLGNAYHAAARYDDAIQTLQRCIDAREAMDELVAAGSSRHNLAAVYERLARYEEALMLQESALETFRKFDAKSYEALVLGAGMSNVYQRMGLWDKALDTLLQALVIVRELNNPFSLIRTLNNLGWTYRRMGKLALAQQHLTEGLDLAREVGDRYTEPLLMAGLADVHRDLARYPEAIEMRLTAHKMIVAGMRGHETDSLNGLAELHAAAGLPDQARQWFEEAMATASERGERHQHGRALAGLGKLLGSREHLENAIDLLDVVAPLEAEAARHVLAGL